jgi:hypothetical protein
MLGVIIRKCIESECGWAIAEQFESTWENRSDFTNCNINALEDISTVIDSIMDSQIFTKYAISEIDIYRNELNNFLKDYNE